MGRKAFLAVGAALGAGLYLYPPAVLQTFLHDYLLVCIVTYVIVVLIVGRLLLDVEGGRVDSSGKAVLITGCDSGFGWLLAKRLDALGFVVFAGCLAPDREEALRLKKAASSRLHVVELNVTDDWHVQRTQTFVSDHLKGAELWAVVNNAGIGLVGEIEWCSVDQFQKILDVNVLGVVRVTKAFLPLLRHSQGRVINVASTAGRLTLPMYAAYSMSKRAVVAFSDALRQEMHKFGVTVITIEPSLYRTPIAMAGPYIDANRRSWSETPTDVREDYGEEYFDAALSKIRASFDKARPQVEEVIQQMELAVCARRPSHRYVPNWVTYVRLEILRHLPATWTDKVFSGMSPSVKPQLVKRQESVRGLS